VDLVRATGWRGRADGRMTRRPSDNNTKEVVSRPRRSRISQEIRATFAPDRPGIALLVMDVQVGVLSRYDDSEGLMVTLARALKAARRARLAIIYACVAFRNGYPEVSPRNRSFSNIAQRGEFLEGDAGASIHPMVTPNMGDIVVTKRRTSAFSGSDLEVLLRARNIHRLVCAGFATGGVILSTVRDAADRDLELCVLSDACADPDPEVHRILVEKVFPRQAEVITVAEWIKRLSGDPQHQGGSAAGVIQSPV
jgi:nicotinamidase-related amidase